MSGGRALPLQNRVDPFGAVQVSSARGALMGNRGCLHDAHKRLGRRRWTTKSWITCTLEADGWRREIMAPGCYTELFFLDEVTSLAAGHRPCWQCRRVSYDNFVAAASSCLQVATGNRLRATDLDAVLHAERVTDVSSRHLQDAFEAPDGAMLTDEVASSAWLKWRGMLHLWSFEGYVRAEPIRPEPMRVLTPPSIVEILRAGYLPEIHVSADGQAVR